MIQNNLMMSRETRKLLNKFDSMSQSNNITTLHTLYHIYHAEQIMLIYYFNPVSNLINSKIDSIKNKSSKHFQIDYWIPIINRLFNQNASVKRDTSIIYYDEDDKYIKSFECISKYLITDYSTNDSKLIGEIIRKYKLLDITDACEVGKKHGVYSVAYLMAVLDNINATHQIKMNEIKSLANKADKSNEILNKEKCQHTIMDVASAAYKWDKMKEDAEIERKFNEMFGDNKI